MTGKLKIIFTIIQVVLMAVSVAVLLMYIFDAIGEGGFIGWAYILMGLAGAIVAIFAIAGIFINFRSGVKVLIGIALLAIIVVIAYNMATPFLPPKLALLFTPAVATASEAGILSMYILLGITAVSVLFVELARIFK